MKLTIGNYIEKSANIDFSKLDKGDFFSRKHPEIITMIENMDETDNSEDTQRIKAFAAKYFEKLNADIEANPSAIVSNGQSKPSARKSKLKNLKTKKLNTPSRERKPKQKAEKPTKERTKKEPKAKNKKAKFHEGQQLYMYNDNGGVEKTVIDTVGHKENGEPFYEYSTNGQKHESRESTILAHIKAKTASIDKPLPEHTEKVPVEISFLRRFLSMDGKTKNREEFLTMLKSLQAAITERKIRKTSPYAKQIEYMQDSLLRLIDATMGNGSILVTFHKPKLEELRALVSGISTMPAISVIKAYLKIQGRSGVKEEAKKIFEKISSAKASLNASDILHAKLKAIAASLDDYISGNADTVSVTTSVLNGLMGIDGIDEIEQTKPVEAKAGKAMSSVDFAKQDFYPIGLNGKWLTIFGNICEPFRLMIYGKGGHGKSTLSLEFAHYLADQMGKTVLFVANEEGFGATLQDKIKRLNAAHPELFIVDELPTDLSKYDIVFLDSADSLRMTPIEANKLCKKYPKMSLVTIHKVTKTGNFRGSAEWEHDCDTSVNVSNGTAKAEKNRFGGNGEIAVF
jgi:hypothetical protein